MPPSLVLINPWIYDFAAYDLWSKPLGLLYVGAWLRKRGFDIHLIDCLDIHHPSMMVDRTHKTPKRHLYGTGKFWSSVVPSPTPLRHVTRHYRRYGVSPEVFSGEIRKIQEPAAFLVTSLMSYWYPGVWDVISRVKDVFPGAPVILGGIYARICREHAVLNSGADHVAMCSDPEGVLAALSHCGVFSPGSVTDGHGYPVYDLLRKVDYICLLTSEGCPYRCRYCASHFLCPEEKRRDPADVLEEILFWRKTTGVLDFAFYDDALLVESDSYLAILLERIVALGLNLRFHTPNAVHLNEITPELARLMHRAGFKTIRLGLETSDFSLRMDLDSKVRRGDFERAVHNLHEAGFKPNEIGVYLLTGLPGQSVESVLDSLDHVQTVGGAMPFLAEYSPIPHTPLWEKAVLCSDYDLVSEPLFHNNTLLPCWNESQRQEVPRLRRRIQEIRSCL